MQRQMRGACSEASVESISVSLSAPVRQRRVIYICIYICICMYIYIYIYSERERDRERERERARARERETETERERDLESATFELVVSSSRHSQVNLEWCDKITRISNVARIAPGAWSGVELQVYLAHKNPPP